MKAIIDGIRFDTDKAIKIGEYDNMGTEVQSTSDFGFWEAGLYKTPRSGRFFLAGWGNYMTHYRNNQKITPMSPKEALEWAERYLAVESVEEHFGGMIEDA